MTKLLYAPFSEGSPFGYKNFDPAVLDQSPFFLLSKFGETIRSSDFYVQKYCKAFPMLLEQIPATSYNSLKQDLAHCFSLRFIEHFAHWWGLVEILQKPDIFKGTPGQVKKTGLLDLLFRIPAMKDMG